MVVVVVVIVVVVVVVLIKIKKNNYFTPNLSYCLVIEIQTELFLRRWYL